MNIKGEVKGQLNTDGCEMTVFTLGITVFADATFKTMKLALA